jgi:hypothetical protein
MDRPSGLGVQEARHGRRVALLLLTLALVSALAPAAAQARVARGAHIAGAFPSAACKVRAMPPAFIAQGEFASASSVADIVQVSCNPEFAGQAVKISAQELYSRCQHHVSWSLPYPYKPEAGPSFEVTLDGAGNAAAVVWGGPSCAPGESLVSAHLEEAPYTTVTTSFTVLPGAESEPGVTATAANFTEDNVTSSVATIVQVEFPSVYAERFVDISAEQLYSRCQIKPHLIWVGPDDKVLAASAEGVTKVKLDNSGNAFVVLLGGASCAAGTSEIEASLEQAPYTTYTTTFTIEPPHPQNEEPAFTIEKLQQLAGRGAGFTTATLTGEIGETVDYEMIVRNTGNTNLTFSPIVDLHCDAGTVAGGPGAGALGPGESATYTCDHVLTGVAPSTYVNEAALTANPPHGKAITQVSNKVEVRVPPKPAFTIEKLQQIAGSGSGFVATPLLGQVGQTVAYEIVVRNTGNTGLVFSSFSDLHCDSGTIAGGPGEAVIAPHASSTYTCSRALTGPGRYTNEAGVTAAAPGEAPFSHVSNVVEVNVPEGGSDFKLEKRQRIAGSGEGFTTGQIVGSLGQTVEYEIVVTNDGKTALTLSNFSDPHCDTGTIAGGPGETPLAPGMSTTYTCKHVLTATGGYTNVASVAGTPPGGGPLTNSSNPVEAIVASPPAPSGAVTPAAPRKAPEGKVLAVCETAPPALHGVAGPKPGSFNVRVASAGIKRITFYLDGRKLKSMSQSQARRGSFTLTIDPSKLRYGTHTLGFKTAMVSAICRAVARSGVFVRPRPSVKPKFTG